MKKMPKTKAKAKATKAHAKTAAKAVKHDSIETAKVAFNEAADHVSDYKQQVTDAINSIKDTDYRQLAMDAVKDIDYKQLAKDALKVIVPLLIVKALASRKKASKWEATFEPLLKDLKEKLKNF